jgi:outer membrane protein assembly factor BamB
MISYLILAASLLPTAWAIYPDEAFKIDYHHALLGVPQQHTTFFHQPQSNSKASLIYSLSDRFIVGAVNPKDGSLVWRQALESNSTTSALVPGDGYDSIVSGVDGQISSWNALDGRLFWSRDYDLPGKLVDLNTVDVTSVDDLDRKDVVALFQASTPVVQKLDGKTGVSLWQYIDSR